MTTALLKQALEALDGVLKAHRITVSRSLPTTFAEAEAKTSAIIYAASDAEKATTAIRAHLAQEEALQRMVDTSQELGLYDMPKIGCVQHDCDECKRRALTTTVTDPAQIRAAFEGDEE